MPYTDHLCNVGLYRLPPNEVLKPFAGELLRVCLAVLAQDNEENGLVCLRIAFDLHKAYRPALADHVAPFLDFARKVGPRGLPWHPSR